MRNDKNMQSSNARNNEPYKPAQLETIHRALVSHEALVCDGYIVDIHTGEVIGSYDGGPYSPIDSRMTLKPRAAKLRLASTEPAKPQHIGTASVGKPTTANVVALPLKVGRGKRAKTVYNPISWLMSAFIEEGTEPSWIDDFIYGAINTGPRVANGRLTVSASDVRRLLRMPELSVAIAQQYLFNHEFEPIGLRQAQRVVQAARIALGGIVLYMDRNEVYIPERDIYTEIDDFWSGQEDTGTPMRMAC